MNFNRIHWLVITILCLFGGTAAVWSELYTNWRSEYTLMYSQRHPLNLLAPSVALFKNTVVRYFRTEEKLGLPLVRLFIPEKKKAQLMKDIPNNIKKWQGGFLVYPDGKLRKINLRHRGDNSINWAYDKKSWRIKLKKTRLINRVRKFNFIVPQSRDLITYLLPHEIHRRMGMPTQDIRLIELIINDKSNGIYLELEQLGESFLRRHGIMPVNLYKGEQKNNEAQLMIEHNLADNPRLWKKLSVFNQQPKDDMKNLENFLRILKDAENSAEAFTRLTEIARLEDWARFAAYETLAQTPPVQDDHNLRLVSDPWRGNIFLLPRDVRSLILERNRKFVIDSAESTIGRLYNQSSEFLYAKHKILKKYIDSNLLQVLAHDMKKLVPALKISARREIAHPRQSKFLDVIDEKDVNQQLLEELPELNEFLRDAIQNKPSLTWSSEGKELNLVISDFTPAGKLVLTFDTGLLPKRIIWDGDGNGIISKGDMTLPFQTAGDKIIIDAVWYANRLKDGSIKPTAFNLLSNRKMNLRQIRVANPFTGELYDTERKQRYGASPAKLNSPLIEQIEPSPIVLEGKVEFNTTRIFDAPVVVRAGTTIKMHSGASLIFRNLVRVNGTSKRPVLVQASNPTIPWGVMAIFGPKAAGSRIRHLQLEGGSGQIVNGVHFIGMLSVHDTVDVEFDSISLRDNKIFDDAMHVVYSKGIRLKDSIIEGAFADALDVDISEIKITGSTFRGATNDAIDLMSSIALIEKSQLIGAGDKGVSVGEGSTVLIFKTTLKENNIGLQSKDGSKSYLINSNMINNKSQVVANLKNWRYGDGGSVILNKVFMRGQQNNVLKTDKLSTIQLSDSSLSSKPLIEGNGVIIKDGNSFEEGIRVASKPNYQEDVVLILQKFGVKGDPTVRGYLP